MKKFLNYFLITLIICAFFFSDCKKRPFDRRNKVTGSWKFTYTVTNWGFSSGITNQSSGEYKGKITYDKSDKNRSSLLITYMDGGTVFFEMDEEQNLTSCGGGGSVSKNHKSLSFDYSSSACRGGLGGGTNYSVKGEKIK